MQTSGLLEKYLGSSWDLLPYKYTVCDVNYGQS